MIVPGPHWAGTRGQQQGLKMRTAVVLGFRRAGKGGGSVQVWQLCWFRHAMITLAAVRRAIDAHRKRRQAELEERESEEQAAREPLSLPADLIVACLSHLTEVSAQRVSEQCGGAVTGGARAECLPAPPAPLPGLPVRL